MNTNPVVWFEIHVQDLQRAKAFYESVFQTQLTNLGDETMEYWAFPGDMERSGSSGALVKDDAVSSGNNSVLVYFGCEDCAVEAERVKAAGGQIRQAKMSIGEHGFICLVADTEGNTIGLHSMQ